MPAGARRRHERHRASCIAAGAAGLAVGVHTTQFAIHDEAVGLYRPLLELAGEVLAEGPGLPLRVAGLVGRTENAVREAEIALGLGYDCGLLSLGAYQGAGEAEILDHCRAVSEAIPLMGFYQPRSAAGARLYFIRLSRCNVVAIKIAPFNRYYTWTSCAPVGRRRADETPLHRQRRRHRQDLVTTTAWGLIATDRPSAVAGSWGTGRCDP